ncbi:hypothetical protein F971_00141 [Acinetobacter vivianii]|uniref:PRTase-CE domain-containing protein n=1 Tax=Acinetobacter vivianii TaxID=1776742 RepID=N8WGW4_9GAMM|nr:hypothetical protein [Acinetobacter vivianii]ENU94244.1 hypothetical protein F971_00141 [Acinetobacter vivianii]
MFSHTDFHIKSKTRVKKLIQAGFWRGISTQDLDRWCNEFETQKEQELLSFLLDSLVFKSQNQITGLIHQLFDVQLSNLIDWTADLAPGTNHTSLFEVLCLPYPMDINKKIRLVPAIKMDDPPTKSGPLIARILNKHKINNKYMCWPWDTEKLSSNELIYTIFFDDFIGTGEQFVEFFNNLTTNNIIDTNNSIFYYIAFSGTQSGIDYIENETKGLVKVCVAETIKESNKFFSGFSIRYEELEKHLSITLDEYVASLRITYLDFLVKKKIRNKDVFGFGDLELTHVFSHGTPNGTLPIFWSSNSEYHALFQR